MEWWYPDPHALRAEEPQTGSDEVILRPSP
jgi:hypothetical protein